MPMLTIGRNHGLEIERQLAVNRDRCQRDTSAPVRSGKGCTAGGSAAGSTSTTERAKTDSMVRMPAA